MTSHTVCVTPVTHRHPRCMGGGLLPWACRVRIALLQTLRSMEQATWKPGSWIAGCCGDALRASATTPGRFYICLISVLAPVHCVDANWVSRETLWRAHPPVPRGVFCPPYMCAPIWLAPAAWAPDVGAASQQLLGPTQPLYGSSSYLPTLSRTWRVRCPELQRDALHPPRSHTPRPSPVVRYLKASLPSLRFGSRGGGPFPLYSWQVDAWLAVGSTAPIYHTPPPTPTYSYSATHPSIQAARQAAHQQPALLLAAGRTPR